MNATIRWLDGVAFVGTAESGHSLVLDGSPDHGGRNLGLRPMEAVLIGAASCSAFDVVEILRKSRQQLDGCTVEIEGRRADDPPRVFTHLTLHFVLQGVALDERAVRRALDLSVERYCSALAMLRETAEVAYDYRIEPAPGSLPDSGGSW